MVDRRGFPVPILVNYPRLRVTRGRNAGVAKWSYNLEVRNPDSELQPNKSGVGFSLALLGLAKFGLTQPIVDRAHRA